MKTYFKRFFKNFDYPLFFTYSIINFIWTYHDL